MTTTIGDRIAHVRGQKSQSAFAKQLGVHKNSLGNYERGVRAPDSHFLRCIAELGVNVHWLLTGDGPMYIEPEMSRAQSLMVEDAVEGYDVWEKRDREAERLSKRFETVALYDVRASAGGGAVVDREEPESMLAFRRDWLHRELGASARDLAAITAEGESMEPLISPGDVLLVDLRDTHARRDGIYVLRLDDGLVVKRVQLLPGYRLLIKSEHTAYDTFEVGRDELERGGLAIIGRVVWAGRRM